MSFASVKDQALALKMRLRSYRKPGGTWDFEDYPVKVWKSPWRYPYARTLGMDYNATIINRVPIIGWGRPKRKH